MTICAIILSGLGLVSAVGTICADSRKKYGLVYVLKPLTMGFIIALALVGPRVVPSLYKDLILAGLACSLAGDVFMMLRRKRFVEGLVCFLVAHLFYGAAFLTRFSGHIDLGLLLPFLIYLAFVLGVLWTRLGRMKAPVVLYMFVIMAMAVLASQRYNHLPEAGALYALLGSILFVVSDSFLAANRFVGEFRYAQVFILGTYFAAQWLLALSA
jgi:uncharacterized membrane protein YhhN